MNPLALIALGWLILGSVWVLFRQVAVAVFEILSVAYVIVVLIYSIRYRASKVSRKWLSHLVREMFQVPPPPTLRRTYLPLGPACAAVLGVLIVLHLPFLVIGMVAGMGLTMPASTEDRL